jgi:hypothetical protein
MSKKYRPYLSLPMMERIVSRLSQQGKCSPLDSQIISSLEVMILKARHEITKPAYIPLIDSLGLEVAIEEQTGDEYRFNTGMMSPEEEVKYSEKLMSQMLLSSPSISSNQKD